MVKMWLKPFKLSKSRVGNNMSRIKDIISYAFLNKVLFTGSASQSYFQRKAAKKYFPVVLLCVPWRVILNLI